MNARIYELSDNRFLGISAFEVISFPNAESGKKNNSDNCRQNMQEFTQLLSELYKLCDFNSCIEFIWITEKVEKQAFSSKIHIFSVLRSISPSKAAVEANLQTMGKSMTTTMSSLQYGVDENEESLNRLMGLLSYVDDSCVYGVAKSEKCIANTNSPYPYYYTDIIPSCCYDNFNTLISALSQQDNCCLCFQLFPTSFSSNEQYLIGEVSAELSRIAGGYIVNQQLYKDALAAEPLKMFSYYNVRRLSPVFLYNILAFGNRTTCANLTAKIVGLLQSGEEKPATADLRCIDLSKENIHLKEQFSYYPWNVSNRLISGYRNTKIQTAIPLAKKLLRLPYVVSAEEATAFFRLPLYEKGMAALTNNQYGGTVEQFEKAVVSDDNIKLGKLASADNANVVIGCPEKTFTKHALVVGTPGSGKTTFSLNLLLQFAERNIPFLAIEPTKTEYRALIDAVPHLQVFTPGNNAVSPFIINPFIPPRGIRVEQYIPGLASAFKAAFSMPSPLDVIFLKAIRACYIQHGWRDYSVFGDPNVKLFGLHEFVLVFKKLMENTNYSKEVRGNIESAGLLRLTNLIDQNSNIYDTVNTVPVEDLLTAPTVLELNAIENAEQKSLVMALLLINVCLYTKHNHIGDGELKNVILIDEAHVLLGDTAPVKSGENAADSQGTTIKALQDMIAEIRSYGTSIIIADQSPTKVSREVVANTDIKASFRLVQSAEKSLIADSTNMDDDAQRNLSRLKPGEAFVYYSKLESPQLVKTEDVRSDKGMRLSVPDDEIATRSEYWKSHTQLLKPYPECAYCRYCADCCNFNLRSDAEYIANLTLQRYLTSMKSVETAMKCVFHLPTLMTSELDKFGNCERERLIICSRIKLVRKIELELSITMTEREKRSIITKFPNAENSGEVKKDE